MPCRACPMLLRGLAGLRGLHRGLQLAHSGLSAPNRGLKLEQGGLRGPVGYPVMARMGRRVTVRLVEAEPRFTFSFHLVVADLKVDKQFNMSREVGELTEAFLERLAGSLAKAARKSKGAGEGRLRPSFVTAEGAEVRAGTHRTVGDFLRLERLQMVVDSQAYTVVVNPPMVTELKVSEVVVASLPIYPHRLELEFAEEEQTEVEWFVSERVEEKQVEKEAKANKKRKVEVEEAREWRSVGRGRRYTPTPDDIQRRWTFCSY